VSSILFLIFNLAIFYVIYLACKEDDQLDLPGGSQSSDSELQRGHIQRPSVSTRQY